jgi:signal peptidase I
MKVQGKHARNAMPGENASRSELGIQEANHPAGTSATRDEEDARSEGIARSEGVSQGKGRHIFRGIVETLIIIVGALILTTLLKTFIIDQYEIPTGSMAPTIEIDDRLFAEKVSYHFVMPKPGDIVTFNDPIEGGRVLIKRCIAVGGQTVDIVDGKVLVDGQALNEPYTHGKPSVPLNQMVGVHFEYPYTIPEGSIWVMGDNRTDSLDSRYFGTIPQEELIGRALFRFLPLDRFGAID